MDAVGVEALSQLRDRNGPRWIVTPWLFHRSAVPPLDPPTTALPASDRL
jgi:hypothetical protein